MNLYVTTRPGAQARPLVPERVRPLARTPFYALRGIRARILARVQRMPDAEGADPIVSHPNTWSGAQLALPARMCSDFNGFQTAFGFRGRAVAAGRS